MGIIDSFHKLRLSLQMHILFFSSCFLICSTLIIITKFQVDWLNEKLVSISDSIYEDRILAQNKALINIEAKYLESDFMNYEAFITILAHTDEIINSADPMYEENPFKSSTAHIHSEAPTTTYEFGVYYSRNTLSEEGLELVKRESCLNKIYPPMFLSESLGSYQGYEIDEILIYYPGIITTSENYTPKVREWYYKPIQSPNLTIITEPYIGVYSNDWVLTVSKAILDKNSEYIGVAAYDFTVKSLSEKIKKVKILNHGFMILISRKGMLVSFPEIWEKKAKSKSVKIFDSDITGITTSDWNIIQNLEDNSEFEFTDSFNFKYKAIKKSIRPFNNNTQLTHYLLLCIDKEEMKILKNDSKDTITNNYYALFFTILSLGIAIFIIIYVMITVTVESYQRKLKNIEDVLRSIIERAMFEDITKKVNFSLLNKDSKRIRGIINALNVKITDLKERELGFLQKEKNPTRPVDYFLFYQWNKQLYPLNTYNEKKLALREVLIKLSKKN